MLKIIFNTQVSLKIESEVFSCPLARYYYVYNIIYNEYFTFLGTFPGSEHRLLPFISGSGRFTPPQIMSVFSPFFSTLFTLNNRFINYVTKDEHSRVYVCVKSNALIIIML